MASKGISRSGEAYCLACRQMVDREADKCPGCLSELTEVVKAFHCPKCKTVMAIGEERCPTCGLRFKVKTVKQAQKAEDDKLLAKLIEWGKTPQGTPSEDGASQLPQTGQVAQAPGQVSDHVLKLAELKEAIKELMANRSELLQRMERRLEEEKRRLAEISALEGDPAATAQAEAEIMALATEMADLTMLQAHMESLAEDISRLLESVDVSEAVRERGLAAKALKKKLEAREKELLELKAREEQLARREEMVDRKIQAYAQKKKQLDEVEEQLKEKLAELERERAELERLKAAAVAARTQTERETAREEWLEERKRLRKKLLGIRSAAAMHRTGEVGTVQEIEDTEDDLDSIMAELEHEIGSLMAEKAELQTKIQEAQLMDEDLRRLLKVLDQMLGQLPEDVIDRFSKSEDFALYERVLDRFKV